MRTKLRSTIHIYLLCAIAIIVSFACNAILPKSTTPPNGADPSATRKVVLPTDIIPTEIIATQPATNELDVSDVAITREEKYYPISGTTSNELRQQLNKLGPIDKETGKRFDARTDWFIEWHYFYKESSKDCKLDKSRVDVSLKLTFTYPQWKYPSDAPSALTGKWDTYMENLVFHEEGHATIAGEGAQVIYDTIVNMPPSATCDALGKATNAAAQQKIDEIKQREKDYDSKTGHGETQGAVFP